MLLTIFQKKQQTGERLAEAEIDCSETKPTWAGLVEGGRGYAVGTE